MALYRKHVLQRIHHTFPESTLAMIRALVAEFMGTLFLMLIGCLSILPSEASPDLDNLLAPALCFSTIVAAMVHVIGPTSGCNINPVVTLALLAVGRIQPFKACLYVVAQLSGGVAGSAILWLVSPAQWVEEFDLAISMVNTKAGVTPFQACLCEIIITCVFLLVVLVVADPDPHKDFEGYPSYTVGLALLTCILAGAPYSGSSMNPARSFGPALLRWNWTNHWVWWVGPILGSLLAAAIYQLVLTQGIHKFEEDDNKKEETIGAVDSEKVHFEHKDDDMLDKISIEAPPSETGNGVIKAVINGFQNPTSNVGATNA